MKWVGCQHTNPADARPRYTVGVKTPPKYYRDDVHVSTVCMAHVTWNPSSHVETTNTLMCCVEHPLSAFSLTFRRAMATTYLTESRNVLQCTSTRHIRLPYNHFLFFTSSQPLTNFWSWLSPVQYKIRWSRDRGRTTRSLRLVTQGPPWSHDAGYEGQSDSKSISGDIPSMQTAALRLEMLNLSL